MDVSASSPGLTPAEIDELCACTSLRPHEVVAVHAKYVQLKPDGNGRVSRAALELMPELAANPLRQPLLAVFSTAADGSLDFLEVVDLFSAMAKAAPLDVKLSVAFRMYDLDGDGFIGRSDVRGVIELIAPQSSALLTEDEVHAIVARVLAEGDVDGNEKISPTEFTKLLRRVPDFRKKFVMSVLLE